MGSVAAHEKKRIKNDPGLFIWGERQLNDNLVLTILHMTYKLHSISSSKYSNPDKLFIRNELVPLLGSKILMASWFKEGLSERSWSTARSCLQWQIAHNELFREKTLLFVYETNLHASQSSSVWRMFGIRSWMQQWFAFLSMCCLFLLKL